jgi:hypothetical protein
MTPDFSTCQGITDSTAKIECMMDQQVIDQLQHQDDPTTPFVLTTPPHVNTHDLTTDMSNTTITIPPYVPSWWEGVAFEDKIILMLLLISISLVVITTLVKLLHKDTNA